jgi:hypothetical protein
MIVDTHGAREFIRKVVCYELSVIREVEVEKSGKHVASCYDQNTIDMSDEARFFLAFSCRPHNGEMQNDTGEFNSLLLASVFRSLARTCQVERKKETLGSVKYSSRCGKTIVPGHRLFSPARIKMQRMFFIMRMRSFRKGELIISMY